MLGLRHLLKWIPTAIAAVEIINRIAHHTHQEKLQLTCLTVKGKQSSDPHQSKIDSWVDRDPSRLTDKRHKPAILLNQNQGLQCIFDKCLGWIIREEPEGEGKLYSIDEVNHPIAQAEKTCIIWEGSYLVQNIFKYIIPKN